MGVKREMIHLYRGIYATVQTAYGASTTRKPV
jgi:hypothetical protein